MSYFSRKVTVTVTRYFFEVTFPTLEKGGLVLGRCASYK